MGAIISRVPWRERRMAIPWAAAWERWKETARVAMWVVGWWDRMEVGKEEAVESRRNCLVP